MALTRPSSGERRACYKLTANIFETIKERASCFDLVQELGFNLNGSSMIRCPDPEHKDANPSCQVNREYLYCHGCQKSWSAIDLVMEIKGWDLMTSARWLAEREGISWPEKEQRKEARQEYEKKLNRQQELEKRLNFWAKNLRKEDIRYLKRRGFTDDFIKQQRFGYCGQKLPQDLEAARRLGLLTTTKQGKDFYLPNGRLIIPLFQYGRPAQVAFHRPGGEGSGKYLYPAGWPKPLIRLFKRGETPFLTEGVFDYLSLVQAGLPAMTALGVALSKAQRQELSKVDEFYIAFDGDDPGRRAAIELAREFFPAGRVIDLPEGRDVNDLLQELGPEKLKSFMLQTSMEAKNYLDILLDRLEANPDDETAREEALLFTAKIKSGVNRDLRTDQLAKTLKPLGITKTAVREEVARQQKEQAAQEKAEVDDEKETQADVLINIAMANAFLFHVETKDGFAVIELEGHKETHPLQGRFFRHWLVRHYYEQTGKSPSSEAVRQALGVIEAKAIFDGPEHKLHLRIAAHDGAIYYDLANETWQAVKITADGWEVINSTPFPLFRRFKNTAAQVLPERGGSLELLKKYINLQNDKDWLLMQACNASSLIPEIPHVLSIFYGDKGSAKTTAQRVNRKLIDPAHRDTMTLPTNKNELALMLMTNYAPVFDNLDGLQAWQSDMLCQAATGGGISKRELYTDIDEVILSFRRCPSLNGINQVASRDDLLDRSVLFQLNRIDEADRKEEAVFWQEFEKDRPFILGALFDAISGAMRIYPTLKLDRLPRMADFARWGVAVAEAIKRGSGSEFLKAYYMNIAGAVEEAVMGDMVGAAIVYFMDGKETWTGTATELLGLLNELPSVNVKEKAWPKRPHTLTRRLNKIKSALADYGIEVVSSREGNLSRRRLLQLKNNTVHCVHTVHERANPLSPKALSLDATSDAIGRNEKVASIKDPLSPKALDGMDAMDAKIPTVTGGGFGENDLY